MDNKTIVKKIINEMNKGKDTMTTVVEMHEQTVNIKHNEIVTVENNRSRVSVTKTNENNSDDVIHKLSPIKSFLYRNQKNNLTTSYIPMNVGTRKRSRFFRFSNEYPLFDMNKFKHFGYKNEFNDRGYYVVKKTDDEDVYREPRTRARSVCSAQEINTEPIEDHLYEEFFYNDNEIKNHRVSYKEKIQSLIRSVKIPKFFKNDKGNKGVENDEGSTYDSVHENNENQIVTDNAKAQVEDYMVPIQNNKDYCEVSYRNKDDSFITVIRKYFENIGTRKESSARVQISDPIQKSNDIDRKTSDRISKMADRPLPVPVENEQFFLDIDRVEANRLLDGLEDGSFLLRPSTQPNHAYTLSVSCAGAVHNVGVRRRDDGRLALGFARKGQRTFSTIPSLLRYHRRKKLLLVSGGNTLGSTVLRETPLYYQVPKNIPVCIENA